MIKVKQAEVKFALLPLLSKQIVIDKIALIEPEVFLEKSADGKANWEFGYGKASLQTGAVKNNETSKSVAMAVPATIVMTGFAAKNVEILNGRVEYYDAASNKLEDFRINNVTLEIPSVDEKMNLSFDLLYNQQRINGSAELGALSQLLAKDANVPFLVDASFLGIDVALNGGVINILDNPQYALDANIYNPAGNMNVPEITLKTRIDGDMSGIKAKINALNIVDNLIVGELDVGWGTNIANIDANLYSTRINLKNFSKNSNFAWNSPFIINEAKALTFVPNDTVPYNYLFLANAKVNIKVDNLIMAPGLEANNIMANIVLKNGKLTINPLDLNFGGGEIVSSLMVDAKNKQLSLNAKSKDMRIQNLYKEFVVTGNDDFGIKSGGNLDIDINLTSGGNTYRDISQNLKGQVVGIVNKSEVQTGKLQFLKGGIINQLLSVLNVKSAVEKTMELNCAVVRADLANGKAIFPQGIAIDSNVLTLVSDGNINLINDKVSFTIEPAFNKLALGNVSQTLASFVKVKGTIQNPEIRLDDTETIKTIMGVVATGGATYLGSQMLLTGNGEPCYQALEGTVYANKFPKPTGVKATTQDIYQGTSNQVKKGLETLGNTAKDLLSVFK